MTDAMRALPPQTRAARTQPDPAGVLRTRPVPPAAARAGGRTRVLGLAGVLAIALGGSSSALPAPVQGAEDETFRALLLEQSFPYQAKDVTLTDLMHEMSRRTGLPVVVGDGLTGRADVQNADGSVRGLLDRLADEGRIAWWFDGAAVHVEGPALVSRLLPLDGVRPADLDKALQAVGLTATEYPMLAQPDSHMIRIVAPPGYVETVEQTIAALAADKAPAGAQALPVIIRGPGSAARRPGAWAPGGYGAGPVPTGADPAINPGLPPYPGAPQPTAPRKDR